MAACPATGASAAAEPAPSPCRDPRRFKLSSLPLLRLRLDQQMHLKVDNQCRCRTPNRTKILTVHVIRYPVTPRFQTAQRHLPVPLRRIERVMHIPARADGVSFRFIEADIIERA